MKHAAHAAMLWVACVAYGTSAEIDFNRDIRPILSNNCFKCHGPDESLREAGLRLDDRDGAIGELDSGTTAIVPGKPDQSELVARIDSEDADLQMPPASSNKKLSASQKQLLKDWIAAGAEYKPHWAFVKPSRPAVPSVQGSGTQRVPGIQNPIDAFIADRLTREQLSMSPEADRYTLIRRLSLDLTGLPPKPEEADAFVADVSPEAYEKLVDRLLASPHYGERWARRWLDLARYSDTNGYEKDRPRSMWPYRDWVIKALNDDMPFDQFTIRQIAGDMLPGATLDDVVATGFHRNTMLNEEGGIDPQEFRFYSNVDRVGTTATVWLGLTMACAQCHTHKYDPIVHKEFYQVLSFFDQADEPMVDVPSPDLTAKRAEIEQRIAAAEADLPKAFRLADNLEFVRAVIKGGGTSSEYDLNPLGIDRVAFTGKNPETATYELIFEVPPEGFSAIRIQALASPASVQGQIQGPGRTAHGNFVLTGVKATFRESDATTEQPLDFKSATANVAQDGFPAAAVLDDDSKSGWAIQDTKNPEWRRDPAITLHLAAPHRPERKGTIRLTLEQNYGGQHTIGQLRISLGQQCGEGDATGKMHGEALENTFRNWQVEQLEQIHRWTVLRPLDLSSNLPTLEQLEDGSILVSGDQTKLDEYSITYNKRLEGLKAVRVEVLPHESLPALGPGRVFYEGPPGDFFLSEMKVAVRGFEKFNLIPPSVGNVSLEPSEFSLKFVQSLQSFAQGANTAANAVDGKTETGWSINGGQGAAHRAIFVLEKAIWETQKLTFSFAFEKYYAAGLGRFRISVCNDEKPHSNAGHPDEIERILLNEEALRTDADKKRLFNYFLSIAPELASERVKIDALRKQLPAYPTSLAMKQRQKDRYRQTHRYHRGEFLQPKEPVQPGTLAVLPPMPAGAPRDRLTFARWLVDSNNPLVARVTMNRHWAAFFGKGLVRTTEDFGTQGEPPTHPELLDWLAVELMDRGWSQKAMHKQIVMSATYRQSSRMTPELVERDPQNRLYARGPRVRLEAEQVRDSLLAASGLLSPKQGGPSVYPPQPANITTEGAFGALPWNVSSGEDRYRRSLYTFSKRTAPFAMFSTFDAPSGEACVARRDQSNTPLQALTLLNDAMLVEAAEALGKQYSTGGSDESRATSLFRRCLIRPPQPAEQKALVQFVEQQRQRFPNDETLVWTALSRSILNLDELIVKQ